MHCPNGEKYFGAAMLACALFIINTSLERLFWPCFSGVTTALVQYLSCRMAQVAFWWLGAVQTNILCFNSSKTPASDGLDYSTALLVPPLIYALYFY